MYYGGVVKQNECTCILGQMSSVSM